MATKAELRKEVKKRLKLLSESEKQERSQQIFLNTLSVLENLQFSSIYVFLNNELEPSTNELIKHLLFLDKLVGAPKVLGDEMKMYELHSDTKMTKGAFGIFQPVSENEVANATVCITPLVAFDDTLSRIGHGKGFYDKFFEGKSLVKIGLAFEEQKVEKIWSDETDVRLDIIITQSKIYERKT